MTHAQSHLVRWLVYAACVLATPGPWAQVGTVSSQQEISEVTGGFGHLGASVAALGDLDGDGVSDLAVGATEAVWILFLNADGTVAAEQEISATSGGFGGVLEPGFDNFGAAVAALGDLDGDGIVDLAVGAPGVNGDYREGAVWILFLNADGTVDSEQKITEGSGGFGGILESLGRFGGAVAALGDVDQDGVGDLAVGQYWSDDGGSNQGALWILFLNGDGTVASEQKISETVGGFGGDLAPRDWFGASIAAVGDLDGDGVGELAVGAPRDGGGAFLWGAVWILFMNADGTVDSEQKISATAGGFGGLGYLGSFGSSVAALGDLDLDGTSDLAVGSPFVPEGGAIWILFLHADGTVASELRIAESEGGFGGTLPLCALFGGSIAELGDLDGDGVSDLAVGAPTCSDAGALWILFLVGPEPCVTLDFTTEDDFATPLVNGQHVDVEFGERVTITSSGPNAGVAIFDATPGGPNDPSQDPDLLVDSGHLLILQTENLPPDGDDVFPLPNDDEDGGTLSLALPAPVEARSLRLVDIDATDGTSQVILTDIGGRQRTYLVPANWTGDRTLAQPGQGTLDLVTLAPQPGFGSVATATEQSGFDASAVVRIDVVIAGSAAVDDVTWCASGSGMAHASAAMRNGSGVNPLVFSSEASPVLGGTWALHLDCTGHANGFAGFIVRSAPATAPTTYGELLVGGARLLRRVRPHLGSAVSFTEAIPADVSLLGLTACTQGVCTGGAVSLTNALDIVLGY